MLQKVLEDDNHSRRAALHVGILGLLLSTDLGSLNRQTNVMENGSVFEKGNLRQNF